MNKYPLSKRIIICWFSLLTIGLVALASSSDVMGWWQHQDSWFFLKKQTIGVVCCLLAAGINLCIPWRFAPLWYACLFAFSWLLTGATVLGYGISIHGSTRWLRFMGVILQPSELLKIATCLTMGIALERHQYQLTSGKSLLILIALVLSSVTLLLLQPDFGQAALICVTAFGMLVIARLATHWIMLGSFLTLSSFVALAVLAPYRLNRLMIFLNPWQDPQGRGFQVVQSLIAIGSGGVFGKGLGHSEQKYFYLPMQHTDFIGSCIAEEFGLLGITLLLLLYGMLLSTLLYVATKERGGKQFMLTGGALLIGLQALFHLAVVTGWAPPKGIGLPFVSFGSSSLVAFGLLMGALLKIVINYEQHHRRA